MSESNAMMVRIRNTSGTATVCHPEPKAKDVARERESYQVPGPDPSLRYASFRMTHRTAVAARGCHAYARVGAANGMNSGDRTTCMSLQAKRSNLASRGVRLLRRRAPRNDIMSFVPSDAPSTVNRVGFVPIHRDRHGIGWVASSIAAWRWLKSTGKRAIAKACGLDDANRHTKSPEAIGVVAVSRP